MRFNPGIGSGLLLTVLLSACGEQGASPGEDRVVVLEEPSPPPLELDPAFLPQLRSISSSFLAKAGEDFANARQELASLGSSVEQFLQFPNENNMDAARESWLSAHSAYEITALHQYLARNNTSEAQNLSLFQSQYRIDHWPILPGYVDYVDGYADSGIVFDTSVAIDPESIIQLHGTFDISEASIGFHVVEFLLWGENFAGVAPRPFSDYLPQDSLTTAQRDSGLTAEQLPNNRRRRLLMLTTDLLQQEFEVLQANWEALSPQLLQQVQVMESAGILSMLIEAINANLTEEFLVQSLYPLLNGNFDEGIHSPFSYSTQNTMAAQLSSVENLLLEQLSSTGTTLDSILASLSVDFEEFFYSNFDASKECLVVLYSNVEEIEDVQNNPQSEFEIVECINLLTNIIDYLEQVRFNISI